MKLETRKGLWVSSSFTEKFGTPDITPAATVPPFKTLTRNMSDTEIQDELGAKECTLEDVAAFLDNPPDGTKDRYWNIFYVAGCVVGVCWNSDNREWFVLAWELGVDWGAGFRAFGCNSTSEPQASSDTQALGLLAARVETIEAVLKQHNLGV